MLPISSSAHTALIPWLAGWSYTELDPELRKSFEVALHTGAGAALAIDMRGELFTATRELDRRRIAAIALSLAPPVLAGYALERPIGRHLGGPRSIARGLIAGAVAMALADIRPGRGGRSERHRDLTALRQGPARGMGPARGIERAQGMEPARGTRRQEEYGPRDGLALGLAQAAALIPGVSRNGATLTAARSRGFQREDAQTLSWHAALPVILGASTLKAWRMWQRGVPGESWPALAVGAGSAFVSTTVSAGLLSRTGTSRGTLLPYSLYRCMLAVLVLRRLHDDPTTGAHQRRAGETEASGERAQRATTGG